MDKEKMILMIMDCAREVRKHLTSGFEEKVYKNALYLELRDKGFEVKTEIPIRVSYKGVEVGSYRADMIVNDCVIIELKAINALTVMNEVQLVSYLTATGIDDGLLINFGAEKIEIKRKYRKYKQLC